MKTSEENKTKVDLLLKEYDHRFEEILLHTKHYHKQSNYIYVFTSLIIALSTLMLSKNTQDALINYGLDKHSLNYFLLFFLILSISIAFYFYSILLSSLFLTYLNGSRIAYLENMLNKIVDDDILVWDSKIIPKHYTPNNIIKSGWVNPNILSGFWAFLFLILISMALCITSYILFRAYAWFYIVPVLLLTGFHIKQWYLLHTIGIQNIRENIQNISDFNRSNLKKGFKIMSSDYLVPLITFVLGFFVMLIISIKLNAFWFTSSVDFPLISIPSIFIGDAILLPILNYRLYKLLKNEAILDLFKTYSTAFIILISLSLLLSIAINFSTHLIWIKDSYTGFMDVLPGKLSVAGWWHLCFSIIQLAIIFIFIGVWYFLYSQGMKAQFAYLLNTWKIVLIFSSLSILDFLIRNLFVFKNHNIISALKADWTSFITLFISLIILFVAQLKYKNM